MKLTLAVALCGVAGCATTMPTVATGEPFHERRSPATDPMRPGYTGRIAGEVCGMDIEYQVTTYPGEVELRGFLDGRFPSELKVTTSGDEKHIVGTLGTSVGQAAVDVTLTPEKLVGRVGWREFYLGARGDALAGTMAVAGTNEPSTATIDGLTALQEMTPADAAAVLPGLLTCYVKRTGTTVTPLHVRVGGRPGYEAHGTSSLYTHL